MTILFPSLNKMNHMAVDKTLVSQISVTPEYDGRNLEVQCFAQNSVGYAENSLEIELTCKLFF